MQRRRSSRTRVWAAALGIVAAGPALAGPARAQVEPPLALLEPGYLLSVGEIVDRDAWRDAETVVGAVGETRVDDRTQTQHDLLYVPRVVGGRTLAPGDRLQFFRLDRRIEDPATREPLGDLLLPTGIGTVDSLAGETARVRVDAAFHPIVVGDRVRLVTGVEAVAPAAIGSATSGGRIVAFQEEKAIHPPFDRMFLRPEGAGGMAPGQLVELYRPGDASAGVRLPDEVLGRAMVVRVDGALVAAVSFELDRSDLAPGDLFRPLPAASAD
jgi:hypothetical protein